MNYRMVCSKCGYDSEKNIFILGVELCSVCKRFAPKSSEELDKYIETKANSESLNSFRVYADQLGNPQKKGMIQKASIGKTMSRPAFGYEFQKGILVPAQNFREVEEIFEEFLNTSISLNQLSKKHNLSTNGLKKILTNFTYIGKVKFNGQIHEGKHKPIISSTLFNHVQNKLDRLKK